MNEKDKNILLEIADFCEECASHDCCPETDCVLYRIEKIVTEEDKENNETDKQDETDI